MLAKQFVKAMVPAPCRRALRQAQSAVQGTICKYAVDSRGVGSGAAVSFLFSDLYAPLLSGRSNLPMRRVRIRGFAHPLYYREGTSDIDVIRQVFSKQQYACVGSEPNVATILDCGANIGCTAFYFLSRYPKARVIAIEPDPGNFAVCERNLRPFGARVTIINAAVWSSEVPMRVVRGQFADGRQWAFQVRPCREGEPADFVATTIGAVMAAAGLSHIDILKMDVERSELELFRRGTGYEEWLRRTRNLVIELHDAECEEAFTEAMREGGWATHKSGELTVCTRVPQG